MKHRTLSIFLAAVMLTGCTSRETVPNSVQPEPASVQTAEQTSERTQEQPTQEGAAAQTLEQPTQDSAAGQTLEQSTLESASTAEAPLPTGETTEITLSMVLDEYQPGDGAYFDNVFRSLVPGGSGGIIDYADFVLTLKSWQQQQASDSFYLAECVSTLTKKKASELFGETENWRQYYEVRLIRDLVDGTEPDRVVYIRMTASPDYQESGDPPYCPGERFTMFIDRETDGFCQSSDSHMLRYDVYEEGGELWAYSRNNYIIDALGFTGSEDISEKRVTSTTQNPAKYTQKLPLDSLAEGMRGVFQENSLTRHFAAQD